MRDGWMLKYPSEGLHAGSKDQLLSVEDLERRIARWIDGSAAEDLKRRIARWIDGSAAEDLKRRIARWVLDCWIAF